MENLLGNLNFYVCVEFAAQIQTKNLYEKHIRVVSQGALCKFKNSNLTFMVNFE